MRFFNILKNNKLFLLFLILLIILILGSSIFFIDNSNKKNISNSKTNLIGYDEVLAQINSLSSDSKVVEDTQYSRGINSFKKIQDPNLSEQNQYTQLTNTNDFFNSLYSSTNNPSITKLLDSLNNFGQKNFPKYYQKIDFSYYCQDPECADTAQPQEIQVIINDIKASKIDEGIKKSLIQNLTNSGYIPSNKNTFKAENYLIDADIIRQDKAFTDEGINNKIADAIVDFVKKTFPKEYEELSPNTRRIQ